MKPTTRLALADRRAAIRARWMELLFVEPVNSPLAHPQTMTFMIDGTLDAVFAALLRAESPRPASYPECSCGHNPYLAYFRAGTQALHEALILLQAEAPALDPAERDGAFAELDRTIRHLARQEIGTFATLCQHRDRMESLPGAEQAFPTAEEA